MKNISSSRSLMYKNLHYVLNKYLNDNYRILEAGCGSGYI